LHINSKETKYNWKVGMGRKRLSPSWMEFSLLCWTSESPADLGWRVDSTCAAFFDLSRWRLKYPESYSFFFPDTFHYKPVLVQKRQKIKYFWLSNAILYQ